MKIIRQIINAVFFPSYGCCYRCARTWAIGRRWHSTPVYEYLHGSDGCFPLCEKCWQKLTPKERLPYYRDLFRAWHGGHTMDWYDIEKAVLGGK